MRVLIDATVIPLQKAGVGVYARSLIDHLTRVPGDIEYFLLVQDDDPELDLSSRRHVTVLKVRARWFRRLPFRFLLEQVWLPLILRRNRIDVVHSLHYATPLLAFGTRRVVTFHDMTFFNMPEVHERSKIVYFRSFMRLSRRVADHVIFISQSALDDTVARLGPVQGKTSVIPHGKADIFRADRGANELREVRARYGLPERFILYVGTIEPRKNLPRLVEAFAPVAIREPDVLLVIAGKLGWMAEDLFATIKRLGLEKQILFPGFVPEEDKALLLSACTVFVYPSLYEGFGLPALEAIASGAPTVTSNTSSLPEVVGETALLVNPVDVGALSSAMLKLLASPAMREDLRRKGPKQAAKFSWERTAALTAEVYRSLAAR